MPQHEPLSYDEIHGVQKRERSTRNITKVSPDFYERLAAYLADAKAGLEDESRKGPSPRLVLLQGQLRNLEEMAREIMLLRLHKVTELSFAAVESGSLAEKPLTPEELGFAREVQALVEATRAKLMSGVPSAPRVEKAKPASAPHAPPNVAPAPPRSTPPAPAAAQGIAPTAPNGEPIMLLRILEDVPPFEGEDSRVYRLKREDVITLPRNFAQILVRRKKAVELTVPP